MTAPALAGPSPAAVDAAAAVLLAVLTGPRTSWASTGDRTRSTLRATATRLLTAAAQAEGPTP